MNEKLKILIVDDDEVDRMAVRRALSKAGFDLEIVEKEDSETALASLKKGKFDCIFLDYRLPDRDGLELIKDLRLMGIKVPSIVLTGQGDEQVAVEMMKAGASDYLSKSKVSPEALSQTLRNAIRIHQAEMEAEKANQRLRESNELLIQQNQELESQRQQIEQQNQQLIEASRLKSQFLANMSHELRTPMNSIMGFSQLLLRQYPDPLSQKQLDMVKRIFNNSQNLMTMLNEVLDFSKIEAGRLDLKVEKFDLTELVIFTTEEIRSLAMEKNLDLEMDFELENSLVVNDRTSLRRILVNLLSNAIKFTDYGYVKIKVWEQTKERIALAVEDSGLGIAEENRELIFEAFRQADQTITRKHSGTGLGLAIVRSLVNMMEGRIVLKSVLGKGSTFLIELPRHVEGKQDEDKPGGNSSKFPSHRLRQLIS
jgi:signal transduction histidine kinase